MHLIPASWSHLHILVSVFPSVGFLFCIGVYVAALATNNELMKRACLALFGALAVLAIPTYLSGDYSGRLLAQSGTMSPALLSAHTNWGIVALVTLFATGCVAWFELFKYRTRRQLSNKALYIVLGLSLLTIAFMVVVGELGWEVNHLELEVAQAAAPGEPAGTIGEAFQEGASSQTWSHIHIILNHFPTVGFVLALFFYVIALWANNDGMKRTGLVLFTLCALLIVPTYVTGGAAMWALTDPPRPEISKAAINAHRDMALLTLFGLMFTGAASWIQIWRYRHLGRFSKMPLNIVLGFALVTLLIMAETGHRGGLINHPEIRTAADVFAAENPDAGFWTPYIELTINNVIWFVPWQTLHFFGYSVIFAVVLTSTLRVLGFWKAVSWQAVHRYLPLAFFGIILNVFSGMLMFLADTFRYANNTTFAPKMVFLVIGGAAALYFSLSNRLWNVRAGEEAPAAAKAVAIIVLISWIGVVAGGRLLPYL
jgi:uncharacterized membrane protein